MKKSSNYSCFIILLVILSTISIAAFGLDEASTLLQFKQSSIKIDPNGFLNNWKNASNLCDWSGVFCSQGSIHALNLSNMGLVGPLNLDILMALPNLSEVNLHGNHLSSSSLSSSTSLSCSFKTVDISANNLSVPISGSFLTSCHNLLSLNLSRNSIPGGVLSFGSSSSSIEVLDLSINQISDSGLLNSLLSSCRTLSYLNMSANKLTGKLPRAISALCVNLTVLDLSYNEFSGEIPAAGFVAQVPVSLKQLDLSHNNFTGDFSKYNFGFCGGITHLDISSNGLNGSGLPPSLAKCRLLERLALSGNNFTGELPTFWASFGNLKNLYLSDNQFSGEIPFQLGLTCKTLVELDLSGNKLVGELPTSFIGCSSLQSLNLGNNQLSGDFVRGVISTITSLNFLYLPFNNITGSLPFQALTNCTSLQVIDLSSNNFTGEIPTGFGFCKSLPSLKKLLFANNFISGNISAELGDCTNLNAIDFSFNDLTGAIPNAVWSLPKLSNLVIWANRLTGEMPIDICTNTSNFETLILGYNQISGIIPPSITRCTNVVWISLSGNKLSGEIPSDIGNLNKLAILQLGNNLLSGGIPPDMGNCKNLIWLDLTLNNLTGPIPPQLASQTGLIQPGNVTGTRFAFLRNEAGNICPGSGTLFEFEGIRPERLVNFPLVQPCPSTRIYTGTAFYSFASNGSIIYMDLSYNSLNGSIPVEFGPMAFLLVLNLGHNELTGSIPESLGGMKTLGVLDVSHNHLTGSIPGSLVTLSFLNDMDVSNNDLVGPIPSGGQLMTFPPDRYANNSALCGLPLPPCGAAGRNGSHPDSNSGGKKRFSGGSMVVGLTLAFLIIASLFAALFKIRNSQNKGEAGGDASYIEPFPTSFSIGGTSTWKLPVEPLSINVATFEKPLRKLTFAHLVEATNDFSADTLIGSGGFGEVYKAKLGDGSVVAVKKLARVTGQGDREFTAEMETIGKIKHRNLVPLLGYCKVGEERILVYEYMKYGSLDILLQTKSKFLDWSARKKIAIGSARGLAFLHHSCIPHIIHRDMKSSNVLLDENLDARVSDFGMARLMNALDTHLSVSTLAGTPGYVPPEYYQSFRCTTKGDVYSYGVVLLELLSGKKPIDPIEFGDNNLVGWAKQLVRENRSNELFDSELLAGRKSGQAELYQYLKIACECLDDRPLRRPTMIQVMAMFKEIHFDSDSDFLDGFSVGKSVIDETKEKGPPDQCL